MISVAWRCRTGSTTGSFHDDNILRGLRYHFSNLKSFLRFQSLCFSKIVTHRLKSSMETLSLTFLENFWFPGSYSNGLKIPTQMVLEVDALPKWWRVNQFWRFGKSSCKTIVKLWHIIVLPPHHCYMVWYLSFDFCSAVPAVLSVTGRIGCIVFKWVENANSNGPWGGCLTEVVTNEQILKIWKIRL